MLQSFMSDGGQFQDLSNGKFRLATPTCTIKLQSQTASLLHRSLHTLLRAAPPYLVMCSKTTEQ